MDDVIEYESTTGTKYGTRADLPMCQIYEHEKRKGGAGVQGPQGYSKEVRRYHDSMIR